MRVLVVVNPRAGRGNGHRLLPTISAHLARFRPEVVVADSSEAATAAASRAVREGASLVIVVGGDGTANAVANSLIGSHCRLGIVPAGSANDLALECRIPFDPCEALRVAMEGRGRTIDAVRVNGWHYLTCGGVGLPCDIIDRVKSERWETKLLGRLCLDRSLRYLAAAAAHLCGSRLSSQTLTLDGPGLNLRARAHAVIVANQTCLGNRFAVAPGASNSDGILDICLLTDTGSQFALATNVATVLRGRHAGRLGVELFRISEFTVQSDKALSFFGDGEVHPPESSFQISVVPHALTVSVPREPQ